MVLPSEAASLSLGVPGFLFSAPRCPGCRAHWFCPFRRSLQTGRSCARSSSLYAFIHQNTNQRESFGERRVFVPLFSCSVCVSCASHSGPRLLFQIGVLISITWDGAHKHTNTNTNTNTPSSHQKLSARMQMDDGECRMLTLVGNV